MPEKFSADRFRGKRGPEQAFPGNAGTARDGLPKRGAAPAWIDARSIPYEKQAVLHGYIFMFAGAGRNTPANPWHQGRIRACCRTRDRLGPRGVGSAYARARAHAHALATPSGRLINRRSTLPRTNLRKPVAARSRTCQRGRSRGFDLTIRSTSLAVNARRVPGRARARDAAPWGSRPRPPCAAARSARPRALATSPTSL